jgi:hypothetical protein
MFSASREIPVSVTALVIFIVASGAFLMVAHV